MVPAAAWCQVADASPAAFVEGHGVVQVTADGGAAAAGIAAGSLPGADQVLQRRRRPVGGRLRCVAAVAGFEQFELRSQSACPSQYRLPGWASACAGMADGATVGPGHREAPPRAGAGSQQGGQLTAGRRVHGAVAGYLARLPAAQPRRHRHRQVHSSRDRRPQRTGWLTGTGLTGNRLTGTGLTGVTGLGGTGPTGNRLTGTGLTGVTGLGGLNVCGLNVCGLNVTGLVVTGRVVTGLTGLTGTGLAVSAGRLAGAAG
jgi:hypothetical protein